MSLPPYPAGERGVCLCSIAFLLAACSLAVGPGDVLQETAVARGVPGFSDEVWIGCWIVGGILDTIGVIRPGRWAAWESLGLFLSGFAAFVYVVGLLSVAIFDGQRFALIAAVALGMAAFMFWWRLRELLRYVRGR